MQNGPAEVTIIGVAGRDDADAMAAFVEDHGVSDIVHISDEELIIWRELGITSQPAWAYVNDDGTVEVEQGALGEEGILAKMNELAAA